VAEAHEDAGDALFGSHDPGFDARFVVVATAEHERQQEQQEAKFFHRSRCFP